ncbi:MAG: hypothetical protein WAW03_18140 [Anaerolineae bacterium]
MIQKLTRQDSFTDFVAELIGQPNLSLALGAFLIGLLGNVLASALGDWYLWLIPGHWIIIIGLALAVVGLYFQYVRRKRTVVIEMQDNQPTGKAGVILLLSTLNPPTGGTAAENQQRRAEVEATITHIRESASENLTPADFALLNNTNLTPALRALEWHAQAGALRECWLLGTPDESRTDGTLQHGSAWLAPVLQRWFELLHPGLKVNFNLVAPVPSRSYFQLWQKVDEIFTRSPYRPENIICDITGGLKLMSVGAALACLVPGRTMQYMASDRDWKGEPIDKGKMEPVLVDITPYLI